ncbi:Conserved oligomeric Golgi complex subunit, partial [Phytophthora palmivora]
VGISVLSIVSGAIPIPLASDAVVQILAESKVALDQATTVKAVLDRAHLGPGEEKSSNELGMGLAEREEFLLALLAEHSQPLNKRTIGDACKLRRVATEDGQYLWVNLEELHQLKKNVECQPEPCAPINPKTISLRITGVTGSWDAKIFTKMYCEWKLSDVMKNSEVINDSVIEKAASTSTDSTWGSNVNILNVDPIKFRNCTLEVWVKQTRRLTGCFRGDKEIAKGEKQLDIRVDEDCGKTQTIDVSIKMGEARTVECQIKIEF